MNEYYRIALIGHVVCERDNPMWPVYEELKLAGHAVEVLDPRHDGRVLDAFGQPNLEYLAKFIETFRPHCIATEGQSAGDILAAARESPLKPDNQRLRHVVVFGYLGQDNFGDELIYAQIRRRIRERYANAWTTAICFASGNCLGRQGTVCIPYPQKAQVAACLNGADVLVFMAGLMVDSSFEEFGAGIPDFMLNPGIEVGGQAAACLLAHTLEVPAIALGIGAGPLSNADAHAYVRLAALAGTRYVARDSHTCELLSEAGVPNEQLCCKADLAFSISAEDIANCSCSRMGDIESPYVFVSLRERYDLPGWQVCPEGFTRAIARGLDCLWEKHDIRPVFVDLAPDDSIIHREVISLMNYGSEASHLTSLGLDETLAAIAGASMVVAMRLHASIVANSVGIPSIGFNYEDKVASYYEKMGRADSLLPMNVGEDEFIRFVDEFAPDLPSRAEALQDVVLENRKLAEEAFEILWGIMDSREAQVRPQHVYNRSVSPESVEYETRIGLLDRDLRDARGELERIRGELSRAREEAKSAKEEVAAVRSSHSWRIGNALMRPLSAIKRLLGR